ncbi:hypothetical protein [uncultured Algimonas sp.]|uniref:hypothetical protein n=1 Tax=uncultured Algimonas sp. TaxID=1547920 RepID=UPI00262393BB|nr:hypothetical protein [uncultured Algimonas sp.]
MSEKMKTALAGAFGGVIIAVFIFLFFRDAEAGFMGNVLLLTLAPLGGFAGGWLGYRKK